jgi:hypothetical protein
MWNGTYVLYIDGAAAGALYDPCRDVWRPSASASLPDGHGGVGTWTGEGLLFDVTNRIGDLTQNPLVYVPERDTWQAASAAPPRELRVTRNGLILAFATEIHSSLTSYAEGTAFDALTGQDAQLPASGAPSIRKFVNVAWSGERYAVWGGFAADETMLTDGAYFDARGWAWRAIASRGAPRARTAAATGWAAGKLVVWSGLSDRLGRGQGDANAQCLSDGAVFDPSAGHWRALPTASMPAPRRHTETVEAGGRLVIYEGIYCGARTSFTDDIAIYDPAADAWHVVPDVMAGARQMVGLDPPEVLPDGRVVFVARDTSAAAVLDPKALTFKPIRLPPKLAGRQGMSHAVAGARLLVWGGGNVLDPGGGCDGVRSPGQPTCDPIPPTMSLETDAYIIAF